MARVAPVPVVLAACLLLAMCQSALAAFCAATAELSDITKSSYQIAYSTTDSSATMMCIIVSDDRTCTVTADTCCKGENTTPFVVKYSKITLTATSTDCISDKVLRKALWWTVDSKKKTAKYFGNDIVVPVPTTGSTEVCVEFLEGGDASCALGTVFGGGTLTYQLETKVFTKKLDPTDKSTWTKQSCCMAGSLSTPTTSNPCSTNNGGCDVNADCTNNGGSASCACKPGFTGDGKTCTPVEADPCATNNGGCDVNADCTNNGGTASCSCKPGFTGDGKTCTPVQADPCATNNGGCDVNAICTNNGGTASCACKPGFTGDGKTCTPVQGATNINITLINVGDDKSFDAYFEKAAQTWMDIIIVKLADYPNDKGEDLTGGQINDGKNTFVGGGVIDDIVITYMMSNIDGPGRILGFATPTLVRQSNTPIAGAMQFDSSDFQDLSGFGAVLFQDTIIHEMGHVLGIGTLWENAGCIGPCNGASTSGVFVPYLCAKANAAFTEICGAAAGQLPIESSAGSGSSCGHWAEATVNNEMMSPSAGSVHEPLSKITIGGIEDLFGEGSVDYSKAEPYVCGSKREPSDRKPWKDGYFILGKPTSIVPGI